tara:strand:+ start:744 stop:986 length:243 start_codon:yes stop_codon:yes gene_type:complete
MKMTKIKIYTLPTCPHCIAAKAFLKENKMEFEEINVEDNKKAQEEVIEKSGQMGTPVIDVDGKIIVGFDGAELKEALNIK